MVFATCVPLPPMMAFVAGHGWQGGQDHQDHSEREPQWEAPLSGWFMAWPFMAMHLKKW